MLKRLYSITSKPPAPISRVDFYHKRDNLPFASVPQKLHVEYDNWRDLPHISDKCLPQKPTDIRGIDASAYQHLQRKLLLRNLPLLVQNKFFSVKFVDSLHHLSLVRKSNIAYTFSNYGTPVLNDNSLDTAFKEYKGLYRTLDFFKSQPHGTDTACARIQYRKRVKRSLFLALHKVIPDSNSADIHSVSGIFLFRFATCPSTSEDFALVDRDLITAISTILQNKQFKTKLQQTTRQQNKEFNNGKALIKQVTLENTLGARQVPGYYPKLPFITS